MSERGTVFVEQAEVVSQQGHPGDQFILRLRAPRTAEHARPGSFVHLVCDPALPMRRPFSIMRTGKGAGWIDILYRVFGTGTELLSRRQAGA
jgi:dihydroorotate dehydrogenase electron transfer subunit